MAETRNPVQFALGISSLNSKQFGSIDPKMLGEMPINEFYEFQKKIVNYRKYRRYDIGLFKNSVAITPAHTKDLFRLGVGQEDTWANDEADTYKKNDVHTNMPRNGEWQPGEVAIIHQIEAVVGFTAGKATTSADGIASQPAVAAFPTNKDVFLLQDVVNNQFAMRLKRGKKIMCEGLLEDFPQITGKSGAAGSSASAFSQNMGFENFNMLTKPEVIEGNEEFSIELEPLAPSLDMSTVATDIRVKLRLSTWEFLRVYA